ncbi:MAG: type II toxin-antitoxin system RatA family toxin [Burkholderiaceae bacterium]|nr:type II toxin-antitoxin system RatA family toxin [Burkholderiaceae bacterium]
MHRIERSVLVPYSAERMFRLVERVDDYPAFLPWCPASRARHLPDDSVEATIEIAFRGVRARFTTRNELDPPREIRMTLVDGPFRRLAGSWHFRELPEESCKVSLQLQYQFAPGLLGRLVAPVFESIAGSMIDAFARRAESLYG